MAQKNIAIVTGASSGLGKEFVRLLRIDENVQEIWCIARNQEKLAHLKQEFGDKIRTFSMDLSDKAEILDFAPVLERERPEIRYLVNNAGYAKFCSYADLSVAQSINLIDLNCSGLVAMGLVCLPYMHPGSRLINIASQASFQPLPYQNIYSATKAFVRNYSRALHVELNSRGISVTAVCPGWIDTALYERANIGAKKATKRFYGMVSPDKVAYRALQDARKGKDISVYSGYVKFCHVIAKLLPQRWMMKIWLKQQGLSQ